MKEQKSLVKNSIFNMAYNLMKVIFPLVYASYVAHVLLDTGVGKVSYAQNIAQYFIIIAALGIPNYGIREVAKVRDEQENLNKVFTELFLMNGLSTSICVLAYYLMITNCRYFAEESTLYVVVGITIFLNIANVDWFYQGIEEFSYIAIRSFGVKVISMVAIFAFVTTKEDYVIYALISVVGAAGNNIINVYNLNRYGIKMTFKELQVRRHLRPVFILLSTSIAIELYTLLDTTMIGILCDYEAVGYYTNSMKLVRIVITAITSISGVLLPRLSVYYSEKNNEKCSEIVNKVFSILAFLFLPCGIGMILVADKMIPVLFGVSFLPAIDTFKLASFLIYALGFSNLFGTQVLLTFSQEKRLLLCTIVGAGINLILNAILIPKFQQNGATVASIVSESIVTILSVIFAKKYIRIQININDMVKSIVAVIFMSIAVITVKSLFSNQILALITSVAIGMCIYIGINFVLKNTVLIEFKKFLVDKGKKIFSKIL